MSIKYLISNKKDLCYYYYYYHQYYWHVIKEHMEDRINSAEPRWACPFFVVSEPTLLIGPISCCELWTHWIYQPALLNMMFTGLEGKMWQSHLFQKPEGPVIYVTDASPEGCITWPSERITIQLRPKAKTSGANISKCKYGSSEGLYPRQEITNVCNRQHHALGPQTSEVWQNTEH